MHIFYAPRDPGARGGAMKGYEFWDACARWAEHAYNVTALSHIAATTKDFREKTQAEAEILIGEARKRWWERHPNFTMRGALAELKRTYGLSLGA